MICPVPIEPLEARIAPAVAIVNPLFDLTPGIGKTGATIDLAKMVDGTASYRTRVEFTTNFTPEGASGPGVIVIELFDDKAPLSVQNFLGYFDGKAGTAYDGTFFHRIFDFGSGSESGTDIIQAGGFNVASPSAHIPTDPTVHNEFNPDDPEVQNVRGTLAMAKTAVNPHTGSSEWFINLTNNSSILGEDNNGGFTVFGRIVEGLDIADGIGKAKKLNLGGTFTDLPVQNHTAGEVTKEHLIQITDAKILPASAAADAGHTFTVAVTNPGGAPNLVKGTVDNATNLLKLTYAKGQTGRTEVTVTVKNSLGEEMTDSFFVNLRPNLISDFAADTLPSTFVPGDKGVVKVKLTNNLAALAKGAVSIKLFLSPNISGITPESVGVGEGDTEIGNRAAVNVAVASGKSVSVPVNYSVPSTLDPNQKYFLLAEITTPEGSTIIEQFSDDNTGVSFANHTYQLAFGQLDGRAKVPLTITHNGEVHTFVLSGKGTGTVSMDGDQLDVSLSGTNAGSKFSVKTGRGVIGDLDDISIQDPIGSVKLGNIQLHGNFAASSGARSLVFGTLGDTSAEAEGADHDFTVGTFPTATQKVAIKLGQVRDYSLSSAMPISTLSALDWLNDEVNTQPDSIIAVGLTALRIAGDFEANLTAATTDKMALISVGGTVRDSTIKAFGGITTVKLGGLSGSTILAGFTEEPSEEADFSNATNIGSFTVTGQFADSLVAASRFNSVVVNEVDPNAGTEVGGFAAEAIKSYLRRGLAPVRGSNLDAESDPFDEVAPNYRVALY